MRRVIRTRIVLRAALVALLGLAACGGGSDVSTAPAAGQSAGLMDSPLMREQPQPRSVAQELAEIEASEAPAGVDPQLYATLKAALVSALRGRDGARLAATAPLGERNTVRDLYLYGNDGTGFRLEWSYLNCGDYNLDGLVSVNDLTAVGQHFERTQADPDWLDARLADGNEDGAVTVSDITPIGQNYLAFAKTFNIYGGDSAEGPWTFVDEMPRPLAPEHGRTHCVFELGAGGYDYYQIRPVDGDGVEGAPSWTSVRIGETAEVDLGSDIWLEQQQVGPEGGEVEGEAGSQLEGCKVKFELGSLKADTPVRFGINDGSIAPVLGEFDGPILALDTGDQRGFEVPITITFKYPRQHWSDHPVFFGFNEDGRLKLLDEGQISQETGQMEVVTFNGLKYFAALYINPSDFPLHVAFSANYYGIWDGFQEPNKGTWLSQGGECFGFSCFSTWYFENLDFSQSPQRLYGRFMYPVGNNGDTGQDIIASRAHTSVARMWDLYWNYIVKPQYGTLGAIRFAVIAAAISNSGDPTIIYLNHTDGSAGAHAVVGYGFDGSGIDIYDPNSPGSVERIPFDGVTLGPYDTYDGIYYCGQGTLYCAEAYGPILEDAQRGFNANGRAEMWITSHEPMEEVYAGWVRLQGYVESVDLLVDEMAIGISNNQTYDYNLYHLPVAANGALDFILPLQPGTNTFTFDGYGTKFDSTTGFVPVDLLYCPDPFFSLVGDPTPAVISVVLTWDKDDTDLDLVVVDPSGDYSAPLKPFTADGGELNIDDADGFGPECWALRTDDVVRVGQPYKVRVHYNDDRGHGGQTFAVKVVRYEGTASQTTDWYPGFFLESNSWTFDPVNDVGPDWRDVCTVVP